MTLYCLHYLVTSFSLTVWTRNPLTTIILYYLFQTIYYLLVPHAQVNGVNFWLLQSAVVFLGTLAGAFFVWGARRRALLALKGGYAPQWNVFLIWLALFLAAQAPYAFLPIQETVFQFGPTVPAPGGPWGLLLMTMLHVVVNGGACWLLMIRGNDDLLPERMIPFFTQWTVLVFAMELLMLLSYALAECYATLIAGGFVLTLTAVNLFWVLANYKRAPPMGGVKQTLLNA